MAEWSRVLSTTIRNYLREVEPNVLRNRRLPAMLKEKGRYSYNWSGEQMEWPVQYRRVPMTAYADMGVVQFSRQDRWKKANLDWRGYSLADAVSKKEKLENKGDEAIIKLYSETATRLMDDAEEQFAEEYYIDGTTAANALRMHGFESFMASAGSVSVASGYKSPSSTYAGLSCALANYGGSWSGNGTWPEGTGDGSQTFDFWSPILLDYTHATAWTQGNTWATNCTQVLTAAIIKAQRVKSRKGQLDFFLTSGNLYGQFLNKIRAEERLVVNRGEKSKLVSLGFLDTANWDGIDITWEYGIPDTTVYGINCAMMETRSLQSQLWENDGPDYDPASKTWRFAIDFFGNTVANPRHFVKLYPYT